MSSSHPHLRVLPPIAVGDDSAARAWTPDGVTVLLLLVGLLPFVGLALIGGWSERELGAGAALALLAFRGLRRAA